MSRRYPNRRHIEIDLRSERRRRRNLNRVSISIAVVFALIVLGSALLPGLVGTTEAPAPEEVLVPVEGAIPVEVVRIVDGDTLDVRSAGTELRVRLYGVDTPERGEACFAEATERLEELAGSRVQLLPDARLTDSFGRELRYVYSAQGELIDAALVAEGYGIAWTDGGQFREQIMALQAEARADGRGCLWGG